VKVAIGADHAGYELKEQVRRYSSPTAYRSTWYHSAESTDYPQYAFRVAESVGMAPRRAACSSATRKWIAIAANKVEGIRATLCMNARHAEMARRHNDGNVLVLASSFIAPSDVVPTLDAWFAPIRWWPPPRA